MIMCPKTKASYSGHHATQGPPSVNNAYQSELSSILNIQTLINLLDCHYQIELGGRD
jgi:hypothetical protein